MSSGATFSHAHISYNGTARNEKSAPQQVHQAPSFGADIQADAYEPTRRFHFAEAVKPNRCIRPNEARTDIPSPCSIMDESVTAERVAPELTTHTALSTKAAIK